MTYRTHGGYIVKEIKSKVNNEQYQMVKSYCEKKKISIWKLVKDSVLKEINGKTLDDYTDN